MKKLFLLPLILAFLIVTFSCSNDQIGKDLTTIDSKDINKPFMSNTNYDAAIHSIGLEYFYNNFNFDEYNQLPMELRSTYKPIQNTIETFLLNHKLPIKDLCILDQKVFQNNSTIVSLNDYNFKFQEDFYKAALSIMDINANTIEEVNKKLESILSSKNVQQLSSIEKNILSIGAETYIDSYIYWDKNMKNWDKKLQNKSPKETFSERRNNVVKDDFKGAISGAVWGAVWGFCFGGPPGAAAGAAHGAAQGAIAQSATSLVINLTSQQIRIYPDLSIPEDWTKIAIDKNANINLTAAIKNFTTEIYNEKF